VLTKTLITIGIFFSLFSFAHAEFVPIQYFPAISASSVYLGITSAPGQWAILHTATSTELGINGLKLPICKSGGSTDGNVNVKVYRTSTSTSIVSEGNLDELNIPTCTFTGTPTTTDLILNTAINNASNGVLWFVITNEGGNRTLYSHFEVSSTNISGRPFNSWNYQGDGQYYYARMGLISGLEPYSTSWDSLIQASKANECDGIIECAVAWAFYPDPNTLEQFKSISFASTSPIGYIYDMDDALQTFMTALNATTSSFKITLDMTTLENTASVFNGVSTSSITVFDICWVNNAMGELPANSFRDKFLPMIVFMMWIGLGWLFYSVGHRIF